MSSNTPPQRPIGLIRRVPAQAGAAATPAGSAAPAPTAPGAAPGIPSIVNPALRRYWQREADPDAPLEAQGRSERRGISNSVAWASIIAMALISAALLREGPGLLEPPPRILTPLPNAGLPNVVLPAPPTALPDSDLVRGYGMGAVNRGGRMVEGAGMVGEQAIICGRRSRAWVNDARDALAKELAERFPTFDNDVGVMRLMRQHLSARFQYGQKLAAQDVAERGQQQVCDNLPFAPEYGMMVRAAQQAGVTEQ